MEEKNVTKKIIIECECGMDLLQVQSDIEYFDDHVDKNIRFRQEFYLAMFGYGNYRKKRSFWSRIVIACKYLWTGEMFKDQLCLEPAEAKKLAEFIYDNIVEPAKEQA